MTNQLRTDLIAIFVRRGHKGQEIVEEVREIEALLDGQRCEWTGSNYVGFVTALLEDIREAETQDIFSHKAHNWLYAFKTRILNTLSRESS